MNLSHHETMHKPDFHSHLWTQMDVDTTLISHLHLKCCLHSNQIDNNNRKEEFYWIRNWGTQQWRENSNFLLGSLPLHKENKNCWKEENQKQSIALSQRKGPAEVKNEKWWNGKQEKTCTSSDKSDLTVSFWLLCNRLMQSYRLQPGRERIRTETWLFMVC